MNSKKILVIQTGAFGDIIRVTPVMRSLADLGNRVDFICDAEYEAAVKYNTAVTKKYFIKRKEFQDKFYSEKELVVNNIYRYIEALREELNAEEYGLVINFGFYSFAAAVAAMVKANEKIGVAAEGCGHTVCHGGEEVYKAYIGEGKPKSQLTDRYFDMIKLKNNGYKEELEMVDCEIDIPKGAVCFHPGGGYANKRLPADKWIEIGNLIAGKYNKPILINGVPEEKENVEFIRKGIAGNIYTNYGLTEDERLYSLKTASLIISNDSGPLHAGAGFGVPVLGIFGSTSIYDSAPYSEGNILVTAETACSPCGETACRFGTIECMKKIKTEDIMEGVDYFIEGKPIKNERLYKTYFGDDGRLKLEQL